MICCCVVEWFVWLVDGLGNYVKCNENEVGLVCLVLLFLDVVWLGRFVGW